MGEYTVNSQSKLTFDEWCKQNNYDYDKDLEKLGEKRADKKFTKMWGLYERYLDEA